MFLQEHHTSNILNIEFSIHIDWVIECIIKNVTVREHSSINVTFNMEFSNTSDNDMDRYNSFKYRVRSSF